MTRAVDDADRLKAVRQALKLTLPAPDAFTVGIFQTLRVIAVPVGAAVQRAVVAQQDDPLRTQMGGKLDGTLAGIEGVAVGRAEQVNAIAQARPAADRPALRIRSQCGVMPVPPAAVGSKEIMAFWDKLPAGVNGDDRVTRIYRQLTVSPCQRWAAGDADKSCHDA